MYIDRPPLQAPDWSRDLEQGDVVEGLFLPNACTDMSFVLQRHGGGTTYPVPEKAIREHDNELRVQTTLTKGFALVISATCDNYRGPLPVMLCRVEDFKSREETPAWPEVSVAATGWSRPHEFYLPGRPEAEMRRSSAHLAEICSVTHDYLKRCVDQGAAQRSFGLTPEAQRHLQRSLDVFFARNARDDAGWPSREDLELKEAHLDSMLDRSKGKKKTEIYHQLVAVRAELARRLEGRPAPPSEPQPTDDE